MDAIEISANRGERCYGEEHQFRIGNEVPDAVEFRADNQTFADRLEAAIITHGRLHGKRQFWNIQVRPAEQTVEHAWRAIQNPDSGGVMAITSDIPTATDTAAILYRWACNTVQMWRDIEAFADGMATLATDES